MKHNTSKIKQYCYSWQMVLVRCRPGSLLCYLLGPWSWELMFFNRYLLIFKMGIIGSTHKTAVKITWSICEVLSPVVNKCHMNVPYDGCGIQWLDTLYSYLTTIIMSLLFLFFFIIEVLFLFDLSLMLPDECLFLCSFSHLDFFFPESLSLTRWKLHLKMSLLFLLGRSGNSWIILKKSSTERSCGRTTQMSCQ